jgi:hypothetical protein
VRADATGEPSAVLLGLPEFVVLSAGEVGGEVELLVESATRVTGCPSCGVVAQPHGRRPVLVRDLAAAGRPVALVWSKRLWRCAERQCRQRTWSETVTEVAPRAVLTERARTWAMRRVGQHRETVSSVARQLGVGWHTVMRAVRDYGQPLVDHPDRLAGVTALGVDEHVWAHAGPRRRTGYATGIVDISPGRPPRLLEVVSGRTGKAYADWLGQRDPAWRQQVTVAALDPFRGYASALSSATTRWTRSAAGSSRTRWAIAADGTIRSTGCAGCCAAGWRPWRRGRLPSSTAPSRPVTRPPRSPWPGSAPSSCGRSTTPPPRRRDGAGPAGSWTRFPAAPSPRSPGSAGPCAPGEWSSSRITTPPVPRTARPRR